MVKDRIPNKIAKASKALADAKSQVNASDFGGSMQRSLKKLGTDIGKRRNSATSEISAVALALDQVVSNVSFTDLSAQLQDKFRAAGGLGGDRGALRTPAEAESFLNASVPDAIRMLGPEAIERFLDGKDASHVKSVSNAPELTRVDSNIRWENATANRARGAEDMSRFDQINITLSTSFESFARSAVEIVPQAMFYAAAIESAISIIENSVYVYRGKKDISVAVTDTAKNVARSAVAGLVIGTGVSAAVALGAAPLLVAAQPALVVVGGALLAYSVARRVHTAMTSPAYERMTVVDSFVVRRWQDGATDDELLEPLTIRLELLGQLKADLQRVISGDELKALPLVDKG